MYNYVFNINTNSTKTGKDIPLKIRYYEDAKKRVQIDTGIKIAKRHWSESKKRLKNSAEIPFEYAEFERLESLANQIIDHYKKKKLPLTCKKFKNHFINENLIEVNDSVEGVYEELEKFIEKKKSEVVPDVIKDYHTLKKHLETYETAEETTLTFKSFNYDFYHSWIKFLAFKYKRRDKKIGLKNNSIGKSIKNLKAFLNYCIQSEKIEPIDLTAYKGIQDEVDHIYLKQEEIDKIAKVDCKGDEELQKVQDFFIIGCYTGLRFSDIARIKPDYIKDDFLHLIQKKTSGRVIIPLRPPVIEALKKYDYHSPDVSSFVFNKRIKELGEEAKLNDSVELEHKRGATKDVKTFKKYQLISSHTCRRSFCTNAYFDDIDVQLIMKASGHKTEKAFRRYLKLSNLEAAEKLKQAWGM
ncbi:site-specific integrase [Aequorivita antarctica]|nr:site-specific integrase [Aequorivita antarctica]SRX73380.1 Tyrosine recombinase XerC [Aequorivita antarctica]